MSERRKTERAVVIFDSKFGNTGQIAKSLAGGLQRAGVDTDCFNLRDVGPDSLSSYDLVAIGGPTQAFTASKRMKDYLQKLEEIGNLKGKRGFAFDTKFASRLSGSASKYIENKLSRMGLKIVRPRQSAIVKKSEGPLKKASQKPLSELALRSATV